MNTIEMSFTRAMMRYEADTLKTLLFDIRAFKQVAIVQLKRGDFQGYCRQADRIRYLQNEIAASAVVLHNLLHDLGLTRVVPERVS